MPFAFFILEKENIKYLCKDDGWSALDFLIIPVAAFWGKDGKDNTQKQTHKNEGRMILANVSGVQGLSFLQWHMFVAVGNWYIKATVWGQWNSSYLRL